MTDASDRTLAVLIQRLTLLSIAGLVALTLAIAVIAIAAEALAVWGWYFLMERAIALGTPAALVLFVASLLGGFATALITPLD